MYSVGLHLAIKPQKCQLQKAKKEAQDHEKIHAIEERLAAFKAQHAVQVAEALEKLEMEAIHRTAAAMLEAKRRAMDRMVLDIGARLQIQSRMLDMELIRMRRDYGKNTSKSQNTLPSTFR